MTLHSTLNDLATSFANSVLDAIKGAPLEELLAESKGTGRGGRRVAAASGSRGRPSGAAPKVARSSRAERLPRRSVEDIAKGLDQVVSVVKKHKDGLRAEEIRAKLGMQAKEMPRILKEGVAKKQLKSKGQKRATTYFAT